MRERKKIFVGMSGGVDSSVAAYLLQKAGHAVYGVFIKVWHPDFLPCHWEAERLDAMRVAAHLGIPFFTCDAEAAYKRDVADYFIREYAAGRTPNPDVMCNVHVKFGRFFDFARERGADAIATGHYAQIGEQGGNPVLMRGADQEKDQSYFLWDVREEALRATYFPVGHLTKPEVRALARKAGIPTSEKRDSQGVCFLGHVDIPAFLAHYVTLREGAVLSESGETIGSHQGALVYTIGQRHGFLLQGVHRDAHTEPYYVVGKDIERNTITVARRKPVVSPTAGIIHLSGAHLLPGSEERSVTMQTRYRQRPVAVTVTRSESDHLMVTVRTEAEYPAEGQSCVLYDGNTVVGGGIIERVEANS